MSDYLLLIKRAVFIDSLPRCEFAVSTNIYEHARDFVKDGFNVEYHEVNGFSEFTKIIDELIPSIRDKGVPCLHLTMHGNEQGLWFRSEEFVPWAEFSEKLAELNLACAGNLLLAMAACNGFYAALVNSTLQERPAFAFLIGRDDEYSAGNFSEDYKRFYEELLSTSDLGAALNALGEAGKSGYYIHTDTALFRAVIEAFLLEYVTETRMRSLRSQLRFSPAHGAYLLSYRPLEFTAHFKNLVRNNFIDWRRKFFMIDVLSFNERKSVPEAEVLSKVDNAFDKLDLSQV